MQTISSGAAENTQIMAQIMRRVPTWFVDMLENRPFLFLLFRVAALLGTFLLVDHFVMRASRLPDASYLEPSLIAGLLKRLGVVGVGFLVVFGGLLARYGALFSSWDTMNHGRILRWFVVFLAFLMAWPFTTYGYNFFYDQGHYIDRFVLAALVPLIWFRPVFIYPFLLLVFATMWQLTVPYIGGSIFAHKLQVLHTLTLFGAFFLLRSLTGSRRTDDYVFMTCCLVAGAYWLAAYAKIDLNWMVHRQLYFVPLASYAHGWLGNIDQAHIVAFAKFLSWLNWPMVVGVLVIEVGCLGFLWRRSFSLTLLVAVIFFHLMVFVIYGFLFWTWILLDVALFLLLLRKVRESGAAVYGSIFTKGHFVLSLLLIGFVTYWANPPLLGWLDTRLTYTYRFEAVGASGDRYELPPDFFAPYGDSFTFAAFSYLTNDHGALVGAYGVTTNRAIANALAEPLSAGELFAVEEALGNDNYNPKNAARLYDFLVRYTANYNRLGPQATLLRKFRPPRQFWSSHGSETDLAGDPIRELIVTEVTTLFDDKTLSVIREIELTRLEIPPSSRMATHARSLAE